jgi:hypothetical protein
MQRSIRPLDIPSPADDDASVACCVIVLMVARRLGRAAVAVPGRVGLRAAPQAPQP